MNLTNQQIAQVIAPYLGQDMITTTRQTQGEGKPSKYLKGKFLEIDLGMVDSFIGVLLENETEPSNHTNYNIHEAKLILKPLSEISNEDAIEVGKLVGIWSEKEIEEMQPLEKETIKLLIRYGENYSKVVGSKNDLGIGFLDFGGSSRKLFLAHQFLQSKGYDLPHYLLDGKTLFESGLATYEKE